MSNWWFITGFALGGLELLKVSIRIIEVAEKRAEGDYSDEFPSSTLGQLSNYSKPKQKDQPKLSKVIPKFAYAHLNISKAFALVNDKSNALAHARFDSKLFRKHGDIKGEAMAKQELSKLYK